MTAKRKPLPPAPLVLGALVLGAFLLGAITATPLAAKGALQTRTVHGELTLVATDSGYVVETPGAPTRALPVGAGVELTAVHATAGGDGWLAAGVDHGADRGTRPRLAVVAGDPSGVRALAAPETAGTMLALPALATAKDRGATVLAWLEGDDREHLAVRAARFENGGWSAPVEVSPGATAQLALTATGLADGSVALAWARYDGADDEIVWSRYDGVVWSAPARVAADNAVPDITPALLAAPGGAGEASAWLVWSRYDGNDYRLVASRLRGARWTEPAVIGVRGSLFPTLIPGDGSALVLHKTAVPQAWSLLELDAGGKVLRRASTPRRGEDRPLIARDAARPGAWHWRWPGFDGAPDVELAWSDEAVSDAR